MGWITESPTQAGVYTSGAGDPWYNVKDPQFAGGAKADGVTDDTVAVQAAVDAASAASQTSSPKTVLLPGLCAISSPIILRQNSYSGGASHGVSIIGLSRISTGLIQLTDNTPVIQTGGDLIHNISLRDFALKWKNNQTVSQTNSYGIKCQGGTLSGWFDWHLQRLTITNPYVGIGNTAGGSLWAQDWDDIVFSNVRHSLIDISGTTSVMSAWRKIKHLGGGVATGDAVAINLSGANEVVCDGLDLEDWAHTRLVNVTGGAPVVILGIHVERWTGNQAGHAFEVNNSGPTLFGGVTLSGNIDAGSLLNVFSSLNGGRLIADGVFLNNLTIANTFNFHMLNADATSKLYVRQISRTGGTSVPILPTDATTLAALAQFVGGDDATFSYTGHLVSNATGVPASSALGANVTSVTPSGNDTRGELTIVMAGALAANTRIATITFATTYGATAPKVILVDQTSAVGIGLVNFYVSAQSTGVSFDIASDQALGAGTYKVDYIVIG